MARRRRRQKIDPTPREIVIKDLSHDGRGVGVLKPDNNEVNRNNHEREQAEQENGKVVFVDYALPGERVMYRSLGRRKSFNLGTTLEVLDASEDRVEPVCEVFGECGGCVLQHYEINAQRNTKQEQLLTNLRKIGKVEPQTIMPAITAGEFGYRRRARLGIKHVPKKGGVIVGFRERNSSFIQPAQTCHVLRKEAAVLIEPLREVIEKVSIKDQVPQAEVAVADNATVIVLRHLAPFTEDDLSHLRQFADHTNIQLFLQPGKLNSVHPLQPENPEPIYFEFNQGAFSDNPVKIEFLPTDFIQVNGDINQLMVAKAIELLELKADDRVLDLFCGVGNFTLPIARHCDRVVGIEGDKTLVERAKHNAELNQSSVDFYMVNLFETELSEDQHGPWLNESFTKLVIDPPRSGAAEIVADIDRFGIDHIVYISCNPATLARDAGTLCIEKGYNLVAAGIIDMFPHTAHVESIALFKRGG